MSSPGSKPRWRRSSRPASPQPDLAFAVASDPGNVLASRLGILTGPSPEARAAQLRLGLDLTGINAHGTTTLPVPAIVILDASRAVRWIDVHPDCSTRTGPQQVIDALDDLLG